MIKLSDKIKYIFFDVDGVLSAPRYKQDDEYVIGFSDEGWNEYLENEGIYTYRYCKPVKEVKDFLEDLKHTDIETYVLSTVCSDMEAKAKTLFLDENYPKLFNDYYYVEHDKEKVSFMIDFAAKNNIAKDECLLIDDTYSLLLECHVNGIAAAHISNLLSDSISK